MQAQRILETCLYATDLPAAEAFYARVLGLQPFSKQEGRHLFYRLGQGMLLIFNPDNIRPVPASPGGPVVPVHGTVGEGHLCFSVKESEIDEWKKWLTECKVPIEAEVTWESGTRSVYFRDPADNCLELASPKLWGLEE